MAGSSGYRRDEIEQPRPDRAAGGAGEQPSAQGMARPRDGQGLALFGDADFSLLLVVLIFFVVEFMEEWNHMSVHESAYIQA